MKKKFFEDPEMEVVRFDPRDAFIATSSCDPVERTDEEENPTGCDNDDIPED